jgi:hypothetical protein
MAKVYRTRPRRRKYPEPGPPSPNSVPSTPYPALRPSPAHPIGVPPPIGLSSRFGMTPAPSQAPPMAAPHFMLATIPLPVAGEGLFAPALNTGPTSRLSPNRGISAGKRRRTNDIPRNHNAVQSGNPRRSQNGYSTAEVRPSITAVLHSNMVWSDSIRHKIKRFCGGSPVPFGSLPRCGPCYAEVSTQLIVAAANPVFYNEC